MRFKYSRSLSAFGLVCHFTMRFQLLRVIAPPQIIDSPKTSMENRGRNIRPFCNLAL